MITPKELILTLGVDPYENIYAVVRGTKQFTLLPPTEGWCLRGMSFFGCYEGADRLTSATMAERTYPHATYSRISPDAQLTLVPSPPSTPPVRWSSILDPTDPSTMAPEAHPIHITVQAGEMLYLPAGWWHYVRQSDFTIAVNYWYDMENRGFTWVWLNFLRGLDEPPSGNTEEDDKGDGKV